MHFEGNRNLVGPENFSIQGYRRNLIYRISWCKKAKAASLARPLSFWKARASTSRAARTRSLSARWPTTSKGGPQGFLARAGRGVREPPLPFQIVDQGEHADHDWRDELRKLLEGNGDGGVNGSE
jgi:hypothetical protein